FIGVDVEQVTGNHGQPSGVLVVKITRSQVSQAGLKVQDVITAINGQATLSVQNLTDALANMSPGQTVKLAVTEPDGTKTTISIVLGQLPAGVP
ncbi:MAG: PDZ domain-containing protein, partial [Candidatus Dormibacteria bacterium]